MKRVSVWVDGVVQGVGFRWWTQALAVRLGLTGTVQNLLDGRVAVQAQGLEADVDAFVAELTGPQVGRRPGRVDESGVTAQQLQPGETGFRVLL